MIDLNSKSHLSERVNYFVDRAIDAQNEEPRNYLGASIIGHHCDRYLCYHFADLYYQQPARRFPARIKRIFDRGHTYEAKAKGWLQDAGFVFAEEPRSAQFGFKDGYFAGHCDGIIAYFMGGDCPIELPALWECKCLKDKSWREMRDKGLKNFSSPTYWAQVHVYMQRLNLQRCLFTSVNADSMELHHELIEYNPMAADLYNARAKRVVASVLAGELLPRCSQDRNYYQCKMCDYRDGCL